ncbi:tRNA uridine-5-carboxymethylaminomethyl(34) synthesis GTPase MnmE [Lachnobacterium bovis]|uniref:tRNA modification GTPase MnmE n=1 Tax=Lachnobacterium bovis TaxID=140626 RepID=A0A1H9UCZ6_9FIRM|nr:tRNA uridine-5-carboxymethylaminomethyl(34) synthesis GTPase MnmE [Lachnobacterium bovis]SES07212.1 tRNA modification GTPase [Lachnobacterium bovis]
MKTDTIAAIATALTPSGIGIIRISGQDAMNIIDKVYRSKNNDKLLSDVKSHTIHYGYIYDGEEMVDEVMVLVMRAPNSYTKEDTVEIDCHGGVFVMKRILETVLKYGARPAEPGEFTKRAFLNGRIDLSQAESVIDIINSKNEYALNSSLSQLKGSIKRDIIKNREKLIHEIAFIETALDDPEHISLEGYPEKLYVIVAKMLEEINHLIKSADNGKIIKEGIKTAIVGKPNAGKSSLLNILVGEERAIVTDVEGTTRDTLEENINLSGISLNIIDTAGIRHTEDIVEKIGVDKAKNCIDLADLVIYVIDSSKELDENDFAIMEQIRDKKTIILLNKSDLSSKTTAEDVKKHIDKTIISISAKEEIGINDLENKIKDMFFSGKISFNDEVMITNVRHKNALAEAKESLELVINSIRNGLPEDFFSIDLMNAYESLGTIIGESLEEDLVNEIFSKFCMGK